MDQKQKEQARLNQRAKAELSQEFWYGKNDPKDNNGKNTDEKNRNSNQKAANQNDE